MDQNSQVFLQIKSMKSRIAEKIREVLLTVNQLNYVEFDRIRVLCHDFNETELPAAQIIDLQETIAHVQNDVDKSWNLVIELVMKQTVDREVRQTDLWDLMYQVERKLWAQPNLGIPGVYHMEYSANSTDLHLQDPYYVGKLELTVKYRQSLVREC